MKLNGEYLFCKYPNSTTVPIIQPSKLNKWTKTVSNKYAKH